MKFNESGANKYPINLINESVMDGDFAFSSGFKWFLELEKQRNLRNGGIVCAVTIDFTNISRLHQSERQSVILNEALKTLLNLIISNTRESDILFNLDRQIKLILTNTTKEGAYTACRRMHTQIQNCIQKENFLRSENLSFEIRVNVLDYNSKMKYKAVIFGKEKKKELCKSMPTKI
jgi:hypothetical protein